MRASIRTIAEYYRTDNLAVEVITTDTPCGPSSLAAPLISTIQTCATAAYPKSTRHEIYRPRHLHEEELNRNYRG